MSDTYPQDAPSPYQRTYRPGDVANSHILTSAGVWEPLAPAAGRIAPHAAPPIPQPPTYRPGDLVNGHILTSAGVWEPLASIGGAAGHVEATVAARTTNTVSNAWLLWAFLGGVNAHLAYLYPKKRALILVLSIIGLLITFGISGLLWIVTWAFIPSGVRNYRSHVRAEVQDEVLRQAAVQPAALRSEGALCREDPRSTAPAAEGRRRRAGPRLPPETRRRKKRTVGVVGTAPKIRNWSGAEGSRYLSASGGCWRKPNPAGS